MKLNARFSGRQTFLNMAGQGLAFSVNMLLGFFLTPFIVKHIGSTANGFVGLSHNFTMYASLVVTALNSMAGRFIAIAYFQHREKDVRKCYSSVFIANIVICLVLTLPAVWILVHLSAIVEVPSSLLSDVTILFAFTFAQFAVMTVGGVYNNSAYVANRIDLVSSRNIESKILCVVLIILLFSCFAPRLWYLGLVYFVCGCYNVLRNYYIHRKLMPEVKIRRRYFELGKVKELVASGIWNSVSSLGGILLDQLDLLIINMMISADAMGIVSVAKVIPLCIICLVCSLGSTIAPSLTKWYAEENFGKINETLFFNMRLLAALFCVPIVFLAVFGGDFYRLWVPSMDARSLWLLSLFMLALTPITLSLNPLLYVFTSANKVRTNSLVTIGYAVLSLLTMFLLLQFTEDTLLKMTIVVVTSKFFSALQGVTFTIPYVARLLSTGKMLFFRTMLTAFVPLLLTAGFCWLIRCSFPLNNWISLIGAGLMTTVAGLLCSGLLLFNREEKQRVVNMIAARLPLR